MLDKDGKAVNHSAEKPKNPINISILIWKNQRDILISDSDKDYFLLDQ